MKLTYAHDLTKTPPRDIESNLTDIAPELEEIGGWSRGEVQEAVARFARWYFADNKSGEDIKVEVFRGESLSMVTAIGRGLAIGWSNER